MKTKTKIQKVLELEPNKYHAVRTEYHGEIYDSQLEANYAAQLDLQRKAILSEFRVVSVKRQPKFILQENPRITYRADFDVTYADGHRSIIDTKGIQTPVFKLKLKLMKQKYPDITIILIGKGK